MVESRWVSSLCFSGVQNYWNYIQLCSDTQIYIHTHNKPHFIPFWKNSTLQTLWALRLMNWWKICLHVDNTQTQVGKIVKRSLSFYSKHEAWPFHRSWQMCVQPFSDMTSAKWKKSSTFGIKHWHYAHQKLRYNSFPIGT